MSVGENVAYGLKIKKVGGDERRRRAAEALGMVRLDGYEDRRPGAALRRPAPARRARPGAGQPPEGAAARRAARRARPQAAPADAAGAAHAPAGGPHHVRLRDARPGGGAHDERPPGRLQRRADRAGRRAGRGLRAPRQRVRGRLRRRLEHRRARRRALHDPAREGAHPRRGRARRTGCASRTGRSATWPTSARSRASSSTSTRAARYRWSGRTSRCPRRRRSSSGGGGCASRWRGEHAYAIPDSQEQPEEGL